MREKEKVGEREKKRESEKGKREKEGKRELEQHFLLWSSKNSLENRRT